MIASALCKWGDVHPKISPGDKGLHWGKRMVKSFESSCFALCKQNNKRNFEFYLLKVHCCFVNLNIYILLSSNIHKTTWHSDCPLPARLLQTELCWQEQGESHVQSWNVAFQWNGRCQFLYPQTHTTSGFLGCGL